MDPSGLGLRVHLRTFPGGVALALDGELDVATVHELARKVDVVVAAAPAVCVIDLAELCFIDSKGMHALLDADRRLRCWCEGVVVQGLRPNVRRALDLVGVTELLNLADDGA